MNFRYSLVMAVLVGLSLAQRVRQQQRQRQQQQQQQQQGNDNDAIVEEAEVTHLGATHSIVTYLGNDFILKDGCKLESCNPRDRF
jgi:Na+/glutamate symporter